MNQDGPQRRETDAEKEARDVAAAIDAEELEWAKAGMDPNRVQWNMFLNVARIDACVKILVAKGVVSFEEADLYFKKSILDSYRSIRMQHQAEVEEERGKVKIYGVDGGTLN